MKVEIKDYTPQIISEKNQKASIFLRGIADAIVSLSETKTPKKTGRLRMDIIKQVLGLRGKIIWGKNYAVFQETKQFQNYSTPGTGPHFAENAVNDVVSKTESIAKSSGLI